MASLTKCPACSKQISKAARACPGCGHPMRRGGGAPIGMLRLVLFVAILMFGWHCAVLEIWRQQDAEDGQLWSYNPVTNVITVGDAESSSGSPLGQPVEAGWTALTNEFGSALIQPAMTARAREWFDLYGMVVGYRISLGA